MPGDIRGRYVGLDRGATAIDGLRPDDAIARHNRRVPADAQGDACTCPKCAGLTAAGYSSSILSTDNKRLFRELAEAYLLSPRAARVVGPAAAIFASPAGAQRPMSTVYLSTPSVAPDGFAQRQFARRGPVQDESKFCDPLDRLATRAVEGRSFLTDGDA